MKNIFLLLISSLLWSGCTTMYIPSPVNVPMLTEKDEMNLSAGVTTNSYYMSGAYAFSDKNALILNTTATFNSFKASDNTPYVEYYSELDKFRHFNIDLGIGKYETVSEFGVVELYGGLGYGNANAENDIFKTNYGSIFIQGVVSSKREHFELGVAGKLTGSYINYDYPYNQIYRDLFFDTENFFAVSGQVGMVLRFGSDQVKFFAAPGFNLSYGFVEASEETHKYGFANDDEFFTWIQLSAGIVYRFKLREQ